MIVVNDLKKTSFLRTELASEVLINPAVLPELYTYTFNHHYDNSKSKAVGRSLTYYLALKLGGIWVLDTANSKENMFITNVKISNEQLKKALTQILQEKADKFSLVDSIQYAPNSAYSVYGIASFATKYIENIAGNKIKDALLPYNKEILVPKTNSVLLLQRNYHLRGSVVNGQPAVIINVTTNIESNETIKELIDAGIHPEDFVGKTVKCGYTDLVGQIVKFVGTLTNERRRTLLNLTKMPKTVAMLKEAPSNEVVFTVQTTNAGGSSSAEYDYISKALKLAFTTETIKMFYGDDVSRQVENAIRIPPEKRFKMIDDIKQAIEAAFSPKPILNGYVNSNVYPVLFRSGYEYDYPPEITVGSNQVVNFSRKAVQDALKRYGLKKSKFNEANPLVIGLLTTKNNQQELLKPLAKSLAYFLSELHVPVKFKVSPKEKDYQSTISQKMNDLYKDNVNIILGILPKRNTDAAMHDIMKREAGNIRELPSQGIIEDTVERLEDEVYILWNLALAILSKVGCIPYSLTKGLDDVADIAVGFDIGRKLKTKGNGTINVGSLVAVANTYGELIGYEIYDRQIEGETLPFEMLQQLRKLIFKKGINLENKRILFLRDGTFKEQEKKTLQNIAVEFNATPIFVDVIKSTPVRLFSFNSGFIKNPDAGTVYLRSDREATIVSYSVNNNFGSACPLAIRTEPQYLSDAIKVVLSLQIMNYNSLNTAKLPAPIQIAHDLSNNAIRGIAPDFVLDDFDAEYDFEEDYKDYTEDFGLDF